MGIGLQLNPTVLELQPQGVDPGLYDWRFLRTVPLDRVIEIHEEVRRTGADAGRPAAGAL